MNVLISGCGISGLVLSFWLRRNGVKVTLIEKRKAFSKLGFSMNLCGHCLDILDKMGLENEIERIRIGVTATNIMNSQGRVIRRDTLEDAEPRSLGVFLSRLDLFQTLFELIKDEPPKMGVSITSLEESGDRVRVDFSDGTQETFDLVIGADGVHSELRRTIFGDDFARRSGIMYAGFITENLADLPRESYSLNGDGRSVGIVGISPTQVGTLFWCKQPPETGTQVDQKQFLKEKFADFGWIVTDLIESVENSSSVYVGEVLQVRMPNWHQGRIVLVGDAAYCSSPISARGASLAILGAYILADALQCQPTVAAALRHYETSLRPGIERIQDEALKNAERMLIEGRVATWFRDFFLKLMPAGMMKQMMVRHFSTRAVESLP